MGLGCPKSSGIFATGEEKSGSKGSFFDRPMAISISTKERLLARIAERFRELCPSKPSTRKKRGTDLLIKTFGVSAVAK